MGLPRRKLPSGDFSDEYSVYIYHHPGHAKESNNDWEMKTVTLDRQLALKEAAQLYNSKEYEKVEVKRKCFDLRRDRAIDRTFKIYEHQPQRTLRPFMIMILSVAFGLATFGVTCLLAYG